jgi:hypothetical protein
MGGTTGRPRIEGVLLAFSSGIRFVALIVRLLPAVHEGRDAREGQQGLGYLALKSTIVSAGSHLPAGALMTQNVR